MLPRYILVIAPSLLSRMFKSILQTVYSWILSFYLLCERSSFSTSYSVWKQYNPCLIQDCPNLPFYSVCVCVCVQEPIEARRGDIFWNWSLRCLQATMWVLGIKVGSSVKVESAHNHWAIFIYSLYMCERLYVCMCATCISGAQGSQKRKLDPMELKL